MYLYIHYNFLYMYLSNLSIRYNLSSRYIHYMYHRSHRNLNIHHNRRSLHSCYILSIRYSYHRNCPSNHHHRSLRNRRIHQNHHSHLYNYLRNRMPHRLLQYLVLLW